MKQVLLAPNKMLTAKQMAEQGWFPCLASYKLDGRRCLLTGDRLLTRTMKPQPNLRLSQHLRKAMSVARTHRLYFDGELYAHTVPFGQLESIFKSRDAFIPPNIMFFVFDCVPADEWGECRRPYSERLQFLECLKDVPNVEVLRQHSLMSSEDVIKEYESALSLGYEGLILRRGEGLYKHGRATLNERNILKMKQFETADAVVIGFTEQKRLRADVVRRENEMGRTAKTYRQEDYEPAGTMGALRVRDEQGREFDLGWGRGWTARDRADLWTNREKLIGEWVEYRFMVAGEKDLPRMPQLIRFRETKE